MNVRGAARRFRGFQHRASVVSAPAVMIGLGGGGRGSAPAHPGGGTVPDRAGAGGSPVLVRRVAGVAVVPAPTRMAKRWVRPEVAVSGREAEVLAALAEHLTNAEIGARLSISVRTVETHVSSMLRKLGVSDRRALAALGAPPRRTPGPRPVAAGGRLPTPLTSFVGRAAERAALAHVLARHRLVTVVGPGGVGKTRLALRVAADVAATFADDAWFVDLAPVTAPAMIAPAIAMALGLEQGGRSAQDTIIDWLAAREALLVLDNCEHLLDGVVGLLERLLAGSPRLSVLATSRAKLLVPFEWVFVVPGLSTAAAGGGPGEAVELFFERAAASGAPLAPGDTGRIAAVCRALEGTALAIELASARVPSVGLDGIEAGLDDRLRLLTGGSLAGGRHRSLRSALDWSYELLDGPARAVLRRVSVFTSPFTAATAAAVLADWRPAAESDIPGILAGLAEHSLLAVLTAPSGTRYRVPETIRQYGTARLTEAGEQTARRFRVLNRCPDTGATAERPGANHGSAAVDGEGL